MKIENVEVYGFRAALRGMRNPMNSWDKSDSKFLEDIVGDGSHKIETFPWEPDVLAIEHPVIGPDDMKLALNLIRGGGAHRKFLRQIMIAWDITIPRAIYQEYDTYKVATVRNSCSTMHKLGLVDIEPCDIEDFDPDDEDDWIMLRRLNKLAGLYRADKTPKRLHKLKMRLPEGFLQKSTYSFNYETALHMYYDRKDHKMPEWSGPGGICAWIMKLPYMTEFSNAMWVAGARG